MTKGRAEGRKKEEGKKKRAERRKGDREESKRGEDEPKKEKVGKARGQTTRCWQLVRQRKASELSRLNRAVGVSHVLGRNAPLP